MISRRIGPAVAVLAALLAIAAPASAAGPQPPDCPLLSKPSSQGHAIPGSALVARAPRGGLLSRVESYTFPVRGPRAALERVARVEWALDGVTKRVDDRGPSFQWTSLGLPEGIPAGDHSVRVTVFPESGDPASVDFSLTATDCSFADFRAFPPRKPGRGTTDLVWDSAFRSDGGVSLTAVAARAERNIVSALPARVRGRTVGALTVGRPGQPTIRRRLRAPRRGGVLMRDGALRVTLRPGAREFLTVTGLPAGAQSVRVLLRGPGTRLVHARNPCRMALVRGILRAGAATASEVQGGAHAC